MGEEAEKLLKRRARNPITGKTEIVENMSYKDWMSKKGLNKNTSNTVKKIIIPTKETKQQNIKFKSLTEKEIDKLGKTSDICYNKLTRDEKDAMYEYTMGGYQDVNDYLNKKYDGFDGIDNMIKDIDNAMNKYELNDNIVCYRGVNGMYYNSYNVGDTFNTNMYFSTSLNENIAKTFMEDKSNPLMLEIRVPMGTKSIYIGDNTNYEFEAELLLGHGLEYKVIDKTDKKIIMEVLSDK